MKQRTMSKSLVWLVLIFLIEFLLFRTYVLREISGTIPSDVDQSVYLNLSYRIYDSIISANYSEFFSLIFSIQNTGLPVLGAVMMLLFGPFRLSLLLPNLLGFYLMQFVGYRVTNRLFDNQCAGFAYIGGALGTHTAFIWAGNLTSFRADWLFSCMFAAWIIVLFEALLFEDATATRNSAILSGAMLFIRFYAIVFLLPIILWVVALRLYQTRKFKLQCFYIFEYAMYCLLGGGWLFLVNSINFINYYLSAMTSSMGEIWQVELSLVDNLLYYPKYFLTLHIGGVLSLVLLLVSCLSVVYCLTKRHKATIQTRNAFSLLIAAFLIPYIFLMISNKQPLVISLWNGVFILLVLFLVSQAYSYFLYSWRSAMVKFASCCCLILGSGYFVVNVTGSFLGAYQSKSDVNQMKELNDSVVAWAMENDIFSVNIILDRWNDVISLESLQMAGFESQMTPITFKYAIDKMNSNFATGTFDDEEVTIGLNKADVIVVAARDYNYDSTFPTDQILNSYREKIIEYAQNNLELMDSFEYRQNQLDVYVRKKIKIKSQWEDWLSRETFVEFEKEEQDGAITIEGPYMEGLYPEVIVSAYDEKNQQPLAVGTDIKDGRYFIYIDISGMDNGKSIIKLVFDSYFIPSEMSDSVDSRTLAILYPENISYERTGQND